VAAAVDLSLAGAHVALAHGTSFTGGRDETSRPW
jgi:hypothetical protein